MILISYGNSIEIQVGHVYAQEGLISDDQSVLDPDGIILWIRVLYKTHDRNS